MSPTSYRAAPPRLFMIAGAVIAVKLLDQISEGKTQFQNRCDLELYISAFIIVCRHTLPRNLQPEDYMAVRSLACRASVSHCRKTGS